MRSFQKVQYSKFEHEIGVLAIQNRTWSFCQRSVMQNKYKHREYHFILRTNNIEQEAEWFDLTKPNSITMPNFVEIGQTVLKISQFFHFHDDEMAAVCQFGF